MSTTEILDSLVKDSKKLKRLQRAMEEDVVSSKDFLAAMKLVTEAVNKKEAFLTSEMKAFRSAADKFIQSAEQRVMKLSDSNAKSIQKSMDKLREDVTKRMGAVKDGKDGVSPDPSEVAAIASSALEPLLEENTSAIAAMDSYLRDVIELFQEKITKLESAIEKAGSVSRGGTSAMGVAQAFKFIAHTEEPVGAIDGVNTTYRVSRNIFWVAGFVLNGEQIAELPNFTYAGRVITFSSPIPADYSGKDFEIKYIG